VGRGCSDRRAPDPRATRLDRDLLAGCGVAALARLGRRLETNGQLDELADPHLLRFGELLEDDLFEGVEHDFRVGLAQLDALGESARQLGLG
jgi:hypothetical protein